MALPLTLPFILSCGRDDLPSSEETQQRVQGWWVDPASGACFCPQQAECSGGDCTSYSVIGLLADKRYIDGRIAVSRRNGTMSTMGALARGTYRTDGASVIVSQVGLEDLVYPTTFSRDRLTLGTRIEVRAEPQLAAALDRAAARGEATWKTFPLNP